LLPSAVLKHDAARNGNLPVCDNVTFLYNRNTQEGKHIMRKTIPILPIIFFLLTGCTAAAGAVVTPTAVPIAAARDVLKRASLAVCPPPEDPSDPDVYQRRYYSSDADFSFVCNPAAGHGTGASMRWFASADAARGGFDARRMHTPAEDFHGYPLAVMDADDPSFPGGRKEHRIRLWQAGQWLIEANAFDDTPYLIAPAPEAVSEEIYTAGVEYGLFS
jgi:hypothetical protein